MEPTNGLFSLTDVFRELIAILFISVGSYCGWKVGDSFLTLVAGAVIGRIVHVWIFRILNTFFGRGDIDSSIGPSSG